MGVFIGETGACAADTPTYFYEYPASVFTTDTCTHKLQFSNNEGVVAICKGLVGEGACVANTNCEFKLRCSHNTISLKD